MFFRKMPLYLLASLVKTPKPNQALDYQFFNNEHLKKQFKI